MAFTATELTGSKVEQYRQLTEQARGLVFEESDLVANAANLSALVYHALPEVKWVGFYLYDGTELVVGPFQGERLIGVFDLDSPVTDRFDAEDQAGLEAIAAVFVNSLG